MLIKNVKISENVVNQIFLLFYQKDNNIINISNYDIAYYYNVSIAFVETKRSYFNKNWNNFNFSKYVPFLLKINLLHEKNTRPYNIKKYNDYEIEIINEYTKNINTDNFIERIFCYYNNITNKPKCHNCGQEKTQFRGNEYSPFCSKLCADTYEGRLEKTKATTLERYGVEHTSQLKENREKFKETMLERYNITSVFQDKELHKKIVEASTTDEKVQQRKNTMLEKYGVETSFQRPEIIEKSNIRRRKSQYRRHLICMESKHLEPLFTENEYLDFKNGTNTVKYKCKICGNEFESTTLQNTSIYCDKHVRSSFEYSFTEFLKSIGVNDFVTNKRFTCDKEVYGISIMEFDVIVGNIAIELHGERWHNDFNHDKMFHYNKLRYANDNGYRLIQIFLNEWENKRQRIESMIKNVFGLNDKIYARKTVIREVSNKEYEIFADENHIQGYCVAKVVIGLYNNDKLVSVMSFSQPRSDRSYDWEMIRFCSKIGYTVIGAFSKLLKYFSKNYTGSLVTYCDLRFFNGHTYINNGFKKISLVGPGYFYYKDGQVITRYRAQKNNLKNILDKYDEKLTEYDNMIINGYLRIYDCGNIKLEFSS